MSSSFRSTDREELNGGQLRTSGNFPETNSAGGARTLEPGEALKNSKKSFRYFSFRKKTVPGNSDNRNEAKPLRRRSFKSVVLAIQKFLIRVSVPKSSESLRDNSAACQAENETSSPSRCPSDWGRSQVNGTSEVNVNASSKPNWNSVFSGIRNHGNTCFLNATIQCLSHTDLLAKYFVLDSFKEDLQRTKSPARRLPGHGEVTERLAVLIKSLWTSRYSAEISSGFKSVVGKHGVQYKGSLQHDAQEFLLWLLDAVHEDINRAGKKKNKTCKSSVHQSDRSVTDYSAVQTYLATNQSFILDVFQALLRSSLTCPKCRKQSITFDPYLSLSLPIPQRTTCPVRLTFIRSVPHKRHARIAVSIAVKSSVSDLLDSVAGLMNASKETLVLTEIYADGFRRTFQSNQPISVVQNSYNLFVFELIGHCYDSCDKPTLLMQSLFPRLPTVAILVVHCEVQDNGRLKRFGTPFSLRVLKELSYFSLQEAILKAMPNTKCSNVNEEVFALRACVEGRRRNSCYLTSEVDHPLYLGIVEESLKCCGTKSGPAHVKVIAEWSKEARDQYVNSDANEKLYDVHPSVDVVESLYDEPWNVSVNECLRLYTQEEELSVDDAWLCPNCKELQEGAKKQLHLHTTPDVLIIHLKRFKQLKSGRSKLHLMVDFPVEGLDMSPFMDRNSHFPDDIPAVAESRCGSQVYDLYAVCNHLGSMSTGHYIAICKNPVDGLWYSYDDFRVARIPQEEIVTKSAYLLFYVRRSNRPRGTSTLSEFTDSSDHWVFKLPSIPLESIDGVNSSSESKSPTDENEREIAKGSDLAEYYVSRKVESETHYASREEQPPGSHMMSESCV